jgi:glycosyltransferase involved in cell wall biosynthesis
MSALDASDPWSQYSRASVSDGSATLGVNAWRIRGQRTGVGRYLLNVLSHWTEQALGGRFRTVNVYAPAPLDPADVELPAPLHERTIGPAWRLLLWENLRLGPTADDDVLFCPSFTRPLVSRGKTVVTTHEATLHVHPELYPRSARVFYDRLYRWSARHATLVISDSEAAGRDVAGAYGVDADRIRVIPLAPAPIFQPRPDDPRVQEVGRRYAGGSPFLLFVGKLTGRRNVPMLIEAMAELRRRAGPDHRLVLVGLNTTDLDVPGLAARLGAGEAVAHHEYVSDQDLALLYNAATAFVMPSIYETVSLPVMEAQASGTPVITADVPGLREATGAEAILTRPSDLKELVSAMERLAADDALRRELAARGLEHARRFSWERSSAATLDVLAEAAGLAPPTPHPSA